MGVDGKKLLAVRISRKFLISTLQIRFAEALSAAQFDKGILRKKYWVLWDLRLWVDSNSLVAT